jgi:HEAT repeat protein
MSLTMHLFPTHSDLSSDSESIGSLILALGAEDGLVRQKARTTLVELDGQVVPDLVRALSNPSGDVRWEAAKALGAIHDPASAPALVRALEDERFGVRWLAAEALIALGVGPALQPLMQALARSADSIWLRQGAHHVLRTLARDGLPRDVDAVLAALEDVEPAVAVPPLAARAWEALNS